MNYKPYRRQETPRQDPDENRGVSVEVHTIDEFGEENEMYNFDGDWFYKYNHECLDDPSLTFNWYYNKPVGMKYIED